MNNYIMKVEEVECSTRNLQKIENLTSEISENHVSRTSRTTPKNLKENYYDSFATAVKDQHAFENFKKGFE